jgi:peptidyl-prolyl cis-trans isomerase SurA
MKYRILTSAVLLASATMMFGQMVSSHHPTMAPSQNAAAPASPTGKPAVRVNGTVLTDRDVVREMYAIFPYARQHNGGFPKAMEPEIRKGAIKMIEFEELVYQEAARRGMTVPKQRMDRAMAEFRKQFHSEAEYQNVLEQAYHGSADALRHEIQRSLLIEALLKAEVEDKSVVTAPEAQSYYKDNPKQFEVPETITFQSISIMPPDNANPDQLKEARKRAEEALRQAKATNSYQQFGLLAEKISEDDYRVNMGDHGAVARATLPPEIMQAAGAMKTGQISGLIQMGNAYSIFRLNAHSMARQKTFAEVEKPLRQYLHRQKAERLRADLDKNLRKNAKIQEL